jgi:hypothetical protein
MTSCALVGWTSSYKPEGLGGSRENRQPAERGKKEDLRMNQRHFQLPLILPLQLRLGEVRGSYCRNSAKYESSLW